MISTQLETLRRETHEPEALEQTVNKAQSSPRQIFSGHMLKLQAIKAPPPPPPPEKRHVNIRKSLSVQRASLSMRSLTNAY